ncbi:MAG: 16S rRNA (guanine(966)-N(2))-methyltransferase RsmD [Pseudomonadota bacterium]
MRIIGGEYSGRRIFAPKGVIARPTTDRSRETLFNILAHDQRVELKRARAIDLFAGSGALGLEAISRGAAFCMFIEIDARARGAIRENIDALGLFGQTRIHRRSAIALGDRPAAIPEPFSLAFLDAPYRKNFSERALTALRDGGWLSAKAHITVEQAADETPAIVEKFTEIDRRTQGQTQIGRLLYTP